MAGVKTLVKSQAEHVAVHRSLTADEVKALNAATPGYLTTEFWVTIAVIVSALVLTLADKIGGEVGLGAITAAGGAYAVSRGIAKT